MIKIPDKQNTTDKQIRDYLAANGLTIAVGGAGYDEIGHIPKLSVFFCHAQDGSRAEHLGLLLLDVSKKEVTGTLDGKIPEDIQRMIRARILGPFSYIPEITKVYADAARGVNSCQAQMTAKPHHMDRPTL